MYHESTGFFEADDGTQLSPGFLTNVGFDNYREVFTDSSFLSDFLDGCSPGPSRSRCCRW